MNRINTKKNFISPFLEGVARTFDFAGIIDDLSPLPDVQKDPIRNDWKAVASDYQCSVRIINEECNGNKKINKKK